MGVRRKCLTCSKEIWVSPYYKNRKRYCSKKCYTQGQTVKGITATCKKCGTIIYRKPYQVRKGIRLFCSQECRYSYNTRENHPNWNGGQFKKASGYIMVYRPSHPNCDSRGYIRRARLIAEQAHNRLLTSLEVMHHLNGIKDDDYPDNLVVCRSQGEHRHFHEPHNKGKVMVMNNNKRQYIDEADIVRQLVENDFSKTDEKELHRITEEDRNDHCAGDGE